MLSEFKAFIARGNVLDLAVGVIVGAAFGKIVSSLTDDVLMPAIGAVGLVPDMDYISDIRLKKAGNLLMLIGAEQGWLGQSLYQQIIVGKLEGAPPGARLTCSETESPVCAVTGLSLTRATVPPAIKSAVVTA